jgi:hypothetical protein
MKPNKYVHVAGDGRISEDHKYWKRVVFLNGKEIDGVVYADTERGIVRICRQPLRADKHNKRVLTKTVRGHVEVVFR